MRSRRCSPALRKQNPAQSLDTFFVNPEQAIFGWIVSRHAELYAREYGWTEPFEGLCAQIIADFVNNFDPKLERCWIAEINGENVGCVMLVKDGQPGVARLRLLLVIRRGAALAWAPGCRRVRQLRAHRGLQEDHAVDTQHFDSGPSRL